MANDKNKDLSKLADELFKKLMGGDEFQELRLERTVYKAEMCAPHPVVGYLLHSMEIPLEEDDGRIWTVFVFRTTAPTKGINRKGDMVDVGIDEEILVTANAQVAGPLKRFAEDQKRCHVIGLQPLDKVDIGSGKKMWTFRAAVGKTSVPREGIYALPEAQKAAALPLPNGETYDPKTGEITTKAVATS